MTVLGTYDFTSADSADIGADFSAARTVSPRVFKLVSNTILPTDPALDTAEVNDTLGVLTDCWAEVTLVSPATGVGGIGAGCGVILRSASPTGTSYSFYRTTFNRDGYEVAKQVTGAFTSLGSGSGTTFANGDRAYTAIISNQLSLKKNSTLGVGGTSFGSIGTDSSFASGLAGPFYSSNDGAASAIDSISIGNFLGGLVVNPLSGRGGSAAEAICS